MKTTLQLQAKIVAAVNEIVEREQAAQKSADEFGWPVFLLGVLLGAIVIGLAVAMSHH